MELDAAAINVDGFDHGNGETARNRAILKCVSAYELVHLDEPDFLNCPHSAGLSGYWKVFALWPLICMVTN